MLEENNKKYNIIQNDKIKCSCGFYCTIKYMKFHLLTKKHELYMKVENFVNS